MGYRLRVAFWRARPAAEPEEPSDQALGAFHSESGESAAPARGKGTHPAPTPFLLAVAAFAVLEAIPAGLWVRQAITLPTASAIAPASPAPLTIAAAVAPEPCTAERASAAPGPPAAAADNRRTSKAQGTSGAAAAVPPKSLGGLISVTAPVGMHIYAAGRIVGTTEAETVMLPVGNHDLTFVNDEVGYKVRKSVSVQAGKTTAVRLDVPSGTVNVNASPWAEVWVDNQRVGETPIGNLRIPIGTREFVFRHPELGERRKSALVTLKQSARISVDMRVQ
jgi:hypothetical protein